MRTFFFSYLVVTLLNMVLCYLKRHLTIQSKELSVRYNYCIQHVHLLFQTNYTNLENQKHEEININKGNEEV